MDLLVVAKLLVVEIDREFWTKSLSRIGDESEYVAGRDRKE